MPPKKLLRQEDFLYGLEWDAKIDNMFAEVLADQAIMGNFRIGGDNSNAIGIAQYVVNRFYGKSFDYKTCSRQAYKLRKRHRVFSWLISLSGVQYDASTNRVYADNNIWRTIVETDCFAYAYQTYGDPCWEWLKVLFGAPPIGYVQPVQPRENENVINIPSDDDEDDGNNQKKLDNVIVIESSNDTKDESSFWNYVAAYHDDSESEESTQSPSLKTEASSSNPEKEHGTPSKTNPASDLARPSSSASWSPWKK